MDSIDRLIHQIDRFPTLPEVATASLLELEREDCDFDEIASLVALDPVLAARVMKLANSVLFGAAKRAETVTAAISRLGIKELRNCLITVAVMDAIPELPEPHNAKVFWTHSLGSALVAQHVAEQLRYAKPERAYTASLVHLIGEAVLAIQFTARYRKAIDVARRDQIPFVVSVTEEFGCDASEITARVLQKWDFPDPIARAVQRQSTPQRAGDHAMLASLILASDGLCRDRGLGLKDVTYAPRSWLQQLAEPFFASVQSSARTEVTAYVDGLTEKVDELIDFARTIF